MPTLVRRIAASQDDAEETIVGDVDTTSSIFGSDRTNNWGGMRFRNVDIPRGAKIQAASWWAVPQPTLDEPQLTIYCEAADDAAVFVDGSANFNISSRSRTVATQTWDSADLGADGISYIQSVDIAPLVQEVINRPGWKSGNSLVIMFVGGANNLRDYFVDSFSSGFGDEPYLQVTYSFLAGPAGGQFNYSIGRRKLI